MIKTANPNNQSHKFIANKYSGADNSVHYIYIYIRICLEAKLKHNINKRNSFIDAGNATKTKMLTSPKLCVETTLKRDHKTSNTFGNNFIIKSVIEHKGADS